LRSDDAAGILVARGLSDRECAADKEHVLIIEAGHAPENRTSEIRQFAPEIVFIVDAADMDETPGTIRWISEESIDGMSASTHGLPLSMLAHYLRLELNCAVAIVGIQAGSNAVGENVHTDVLRAVNEVVDGFDESIHVCFSESH
jgi:hydrogenase 3 maturation protease